MSDDFKTYHKINSIYKHDMTSAKKPLIIGQFSCYESKRKMKTQDDSREPLIFPNIQYNKHWAIIGAILTVISCGILWPIVRGPFFERPNYYNRKAFYKWLIRNRSKLPESRSIVSRKVWELSPLLKIVLFKNGRWEVIEDGNLKISSLNIWGFDRYRYKKIASTLDNTTRK